METSTESKTPRIPATVKGIQVNFCKSPTCRNYGRSANEAIQGRGAHVPEEDRDTYILSGYVGGAVLKCKRCGETPPVKSNLAISEEIERFNKYLIPSTESSCPTATCSNNSIGISTPKTYLSFGKTKSGSQRYRCRLCKTTFAIGGSTLRQKRPEINETIFSLLVNKMPFNRICEVAKLGSMNALYWKINFIHQQCLAFAGAQERRLSQMPIKRLYLSVDRQEHLINWKTAGDKRNVSLSALGSADNKSGFVFGIHVNYDPDLNTVDINKEAEAIGDLDLRQPYRRYARLWLAPDYNASLSRSIKRGVSGSKSLSSTIVDSYDEAGSRDDVEVSETQDTTTKLPKSGILVHSDYTMYGHFFFLKSLLKNVEKIRFFLDQDSGIRAACLSAFWVEVLEKRCDAYFVRIKKDLTINQKKRLKADSNRDLLAFRATSASYKELKDNYLRHIVIKDRMKTLVTIGKWQDRWLFYPFPDMSEPQKAICWLTDLEDRAYDEDHIASLYSKATLHGIDRFFMQARRRLSLLERPIASSSSDRRVWYGYNAYKPAMVGKLMDIFRVFYNYIEVGEDKMTPAMRLGLTLRPLGYNDVLLFQ